MSNKKAKCDLDWVNMQAISEEYSIDIYTLAEIIEQKKIDTRGRVYDDHGQYGERFEFVEIAPETWNNFLFENFIYETPNKEKGSFPFLYDNKYIHFGTSGGQQEIRSGYTDIQIRTLDFKSKVKIISTPNGKRKHKKTEYFKRAYAQAKKAKRKDILSAEEFLSYLEENHMGIISNLEIEKIIDHPNRRKKEIRYTIDGQKKKITFARFCNMVSEFNVQKS